MLFWHGTGSILRTPHVTLRPRPASVSSKGINMTYQLMRRSIAAVAILGVCLVSSPITALGQFDPGDDPGGPPIPDDPLTINPPVLDFGLVAVGEAPEEAITFTSSAPVPIVLTLFTIVDENGVFSTSFLTHELAAFGTFNLPIGFAPSSEMLFEGIILVDWDAGTASGQSRAGRSVPSQPVGMGRISE